MFTFYNNESLRKLVAGFGTLFNDMYIGKYNDDGDLIEKNRVPLTYGPKEKFIRRIKEVSTISDVTRSRITLPRMGFEMLGMSYDPTRKINKLTKTNGTPVGGGQETGFSGVPYLINFGLYTFTRNIDENLQLVEQILPYFSPEFIIKINFNNLNRCVNVPIILTSTGISEIYEGDFSETRSITTTFSFIAKAYIYGKISSQTVVEDAELRMFQEEPAVGTSRPVTSLGIQEVRESSNAIDTSDVSYGPFAVNGYYPLYSTPEAAVAASPFPDMIRLGETTVGYHVHVLDGVRYYMPNGLVMNKTQFHGNYPDTTPGPDIPPDPGTEIDPDVSRPTIIVAGGKLELPYKPSLVQNGADESMYYISQGIMGLTEDREAYKNETDEEFRQRVRDYLASTGYIGNTYPLEDWIDQFGEDPSVVRSTYLNEDTTGWILLDWEKPLNLGGALNYSDEDLTWWCQGIIRRINILREFLPNAKLGLWRFGQGRNPRFGDEESVLLQLQKQIFASSVEYEGKTLYDSLDFLCPALYHAGNEDWNTTGAEQRVLDGVRVQRCKDVCDAIFGVHGEVKPVIPIIAEGAVNLDVSYMPNYTSVIRQWNAVEINYFRGYAKHWAFWLPYPNDLYDYYQTRDSLIRQYEEIFVDPDMDDDSSDDSSDEGPIPIDDPVGPSFVEDPLNELVVDQPDGSGGETDDDSGGTRPDVGQTDERSTDTGGGYGY